MDRAQTTHGPIRARGVHAAQFSKTAASRGGIRRPTRMGQTGACPRGTGEYSAMASVCPAPRAASAGRGSGRTQAQAPEAPLSRLQDLAVEVRWGEVERLGGQRLAVELDA